MSSQLRNRRKKSFRPCEDNAEQATDTDATSVASVGKGNKDFSTLNVRRSLRKPKPKKLDDEESGNEEARNDAAGASDKTQSGGVCPASATDVRRETRKSFQNYLETLGYNADFSKISLQEPLKLSEKSRDTAINKRALSNQGQSEKSEETHSYVNSRSKKIGLISKEQNPSAKVRVSSRVPKPKKAFALLEEGGSGGHSKESNGTRSNATMINATMINATSSPEVQTENKGQSPKEAKEATPAISSQKVKQLKNTRKASSLKDQEISAATPLSKHDVDEADTMSDDADPNQTRTSSRVRIPKRKFSLIEEVPDSETKRQKIMSPKQNIDTDQVSKTTEHVDENPQSGSTLAVKRTVSRKDRVHKPQKGQIQERKSEEGKVQEKYITKKKENVGKIKHSDLKKSTDVRNERQEPVAQKVKIVKSPSLVRDGEKLKREDSGDKLKSSSTRKALKRKREGSGVNTSESEKEVVQENDNSKAEHIVLKLTIPHSSPKAEENDKIKGTKHHKHHHHHKHRKGKKESSDVEVNKKKNQSGSEEPTDVNTTTTAESADLEKLDADVESKMKKRKKKDSKSGSSGPLPSDSSTIPHVKLVIKKSPEKQKDVKVMVKDEETIKVSEQSSLSDESNHRAVQHGSKKISLAKKKKILSKEAKLETKKDVKPKAVSAYSLFTKSKRNELLKREPDLDFANTSRRLAEMWRELSEEDQEYWRVKAKAIRKPDERRSKVKGFHKGINLSKKPRQDSGSQSKDSDVIHSSGTDAVDMAAFLKLLGESLCSIGMCLKRQDQMEVHGSLSVLLDTALCSIVPLFCLTSQLPQMAGCRPETQAEILDNLAYIIPGL